MSKLLEKFEQTYKKPQLAKARPGDTVRVHQRISEGGKERVQVFEGVVIKTARTGSLSASLTVRRISSGVGVEKSFMMHSPTIEKIEVVRRSRVRRNYLTYMRQRQGRSARLREVGLDRSTVEVNENVNDEQPEDTTGETNTDSTPPEDSKAPAKKQDEQSQEEKATKKDEGKASKDGSDDKS